MNDELRNKFYVRLIFGKEKYKDNLDMAIHRAYLDLCRTLTSFSKYPHNSKQEHKEYLNKIYDEIYKDLLEILNCSNQDKFNEKHKELYEKLIKYEYNKNKYITCGQAQKWINMSLKYYSTLEPNKIKKVYKYLHIPIDNDILNSLPDSLKHYQKELYPWSDISDYSKYMKFQEDFRKEKCKNGKAAIDAECEMWIKKDIK